RGWPGRALGNSLADEKSWPTSAVRLESAPRPGFRLGSPQVAHELLQPCPKVTRVGCLRAQADAVGPVSCGRFPPRVGGAIEQLMVCIEPPCGRVRAILFPEPASELQDRAGQHQCNREYASKHGWAESGLARRLLYFGQLYSGLGHRSRRSIASHRAGLARVQ